MKKLASITTFFVGLFFVSTMVFAQNSTSTTVDFKIKNIGIYVKGNFSAATITSNLRFSTCP